MTISSIGSGNYYMEQMFAMSNRSTAGGMAGQMAQGAGPGRGPDPAEMFDKVDIDGSGGLDQSELQTMADGISAATGETVDAEELLATYDADGDGALNEEETQTAMEANRPQGPPPPPPEGMEAKTESSQSGLSAGIANYLKSASLGQIQQQNSQMFSSFGGNYNSAGVLSMVNTRI